MARRRGEDAPAPAAGAGCAAQRGKRLHREHRYGVDPARAVPAQLPRAQPEVQRVLGADAASMATLDLLHSVTPS